MQTDTPRDPPMPVWNRESIVELLTRELERSESSGANLAVILAELDQPSTNRQPGEVQNNLILPEIANRLSGLLRRYDYIGRYNPRQLLILLPGWEPAKIATLAEKLRQAVAESRVAISGSEVEATMSFVSAASADFKSRINNEVLGQLETVLARIEESGGNRVTSLNSASKSEHPALRKRRRIRISWVLGGVFGLAVALLLFLAPSWTCAPNLIGDIFDSGELPPPLPANCALTSERPTEAMVQTIGKQPDLGDLEFQGAVTCKISASPRSTRVQDQQWLGNLYADGRLQYRRHVLVASSQDVPGGKLFTVQQYLMPWWRYLSQTEEYCRLQDPSWK